MHCQLGARLGRGLPHPVAHEQRWRTLEETRLHFSEVDLHVSLVRLVVLQPLAWAAGIAGRNPSEVGPAQIMQEDARAKLKPT